MVDREPIWVLKTYMQKVACNLPIVYTKNAKMQPIRKGVYTSLRGCTGGQPPSTNHMVVDVNVFHGFAVIYCIPYGVIC